MSLLSFVLLREKSSESPARLPQAKLSPDPRDEEEEEEEEEEGANGKGCTQEEDKEQPNEREYPGPSPGLVGEDEEEKRRETGGGRDEGGGGKRAPLSRALRSLARSRVARGLLRGHEGPYRCLELPEELGRAAGQSGARSLVSQGGQPRHRWRARRERRKDTDVRGRERRDREEEERKRKRARARERKRVTRREERRGREGRETEPSPPPSSLKPRVRPVCVFRSGGRANRGPSVWPFDTRYVDHDDDHEEIRRDCRVPSLHVASLSLARIARNERVGIQVRRTLLGIVVVDAGP